MSGRIPLAPRDGRHEKRVCRECGQAKGPTAFRRAYLGEVGDVCLSCRGLTQGAPRGPRPRAQQQVALADEAWDRVCICGAVFPVIGRDGWRKWFCSEECRSVSRRVAMLE